MDSNLIVELQPTTCMSLKEGPPSEVILRPKIMLNPLKY